MAYPTLAQNKVTPVFDTLMQQHQLTKNMFAFYMVNDMEEKHGIKSEMTLGFFDRKKFTGEMEWHPVLMKYMYAMKLDGIKVNGKHLDLGCQKEKKCLVTVDSGTSHLAVPTWAYKQLQGKIPLRS